LATPAYAVVLAAVPIDQIERVRAEASAGEGQTGGINAIELVASRVERCPHDLTALEVFPLGKVVAEALDIGQPLRNDAWHPLRAPVVVDPETVTARARKLAVTLDQSRNQLRGLLGEAAGSELDKVRDLYAHASERGEAVVSFLAASDDGGPVAGATVPRVRVG
jgi:hypothetical protein